jgi:hypothetical protein
MFGCCSGRAGFTSAGGSGGAGVASFNGRVGAVTSQAGDYAASQVTNDSGVVGAFVSQALDTLAAAIAALAIATVPTSRVVGTTAPLTGGGNLSADRTIGVSAFDLTGAYVSSGPANTFLAGTGAGNVWQAVFSSPANPADNGKVVRALNGDFTYVGGSTGQALIWTAGQWAPGVDFGALSPVTTDGFLANAGTGYVRLGLAAGSGAGVASAANGGNIRGARGAGGFQIFVRNNADTADLVALATDTVSGPGVTLGSTTAGGFSPVLAAPSAGNITLRVGSSATQLQLTTASVSSLIPRIEFFGTVATGTFGQQTSATNGATGNKINFTGQDCTGTTSTGGAVDVRPGSGTTAGGKGRLMSGGGAVATVQRLAWNDVGLALYGGNPVAQAARVGQATNNTGVAPGATRDMDDVTSAGLADPAKVNANFARIVANMWNPLELALHDLGATA